MNYTHLIFVCSLLVLSLPIRADVDEIIQSINEISNLSFHQPAPALAVGTRRFLRLPLSIAIVESAGWHLHDLTARIEASNRILSGQCQIEIQVEHAFQIQLKDQKFLNLGVDHRDGDFAKSLMSLPRPLIVYTKHFTSLNPKTESINGFTCSKSFSCVPGAQDLVWIFKDGANNYRKNPSFYSSDFNIEAHELSHILGDIGHVESAEPNILSSAGFNNSIPQSLCEKFRQNEFLVEVD